MINRATIREIELKKKLNSSPGTGKSLGLINKSDVIKKPAKRNKLPLFCTECDKELNIFRLTDMASDKKAVKTNFENCKKIKKFIGHYCAKMFISGTYTQKVLKKKKKFIFNIILFFTFLFYPVVGV